MFVVDIFGEHLTPHFVLYSDIPRHTDKKTEILLGLQDFSTGMIDDIVHPRDEIRQIMDESTLTVRYFPRSINYLN